MRDAGDLVLLTVHNQGPPIPDSVRTRLFEPFLGGAHGTAGGLGLGLYIASEIVRAHGGSIAMSSGPGEGTTFEIRLPRHAPEVAAAARAAELA